MELAKLSKALEQLQNTVTIQVVFVKLELFLQFSKI